MNKRNRMRSDRRHTSPASVREQMKRKEARKRAKHRVILVGQPGMLCMAIHRNETGNRNTALAERIGNYKNVYDIKMKKAG